MRKPNPETVIQTIDGLALTLTLRETSEVSLRLYVNCGHGLYFSALCSDVWLERVPGVDSESQLQFAGCLITFSSDQYESVRGFLSKSEGFMAA